MALAGDGGLVEENNVLLRSHVVQHFRSKLSAQKLNPRRVGESFDLIASFEAETSGYA